MTTRAERVVEGLQGSCFQIDIAEIVAHEADDPNAVIYLLDTDALASEGDREVDFLAVDTDAATGSVATSASPERYKIFDRYKEHGLEARSDRSRRPVRYANQLPGQLEARIVAIKREKPHRGARKIRELLIRRLPGDIRVPALSASRSRRMPASEDWLLPSKR